MDVRRLSPAHAGSTGVLPMTLPHARAWGYTLPPASAGYAPQTCCC